MQIYKIKCNCRKPNNGLLLKAIDDLNIDEVSIEDAHCQNNLNLLEKFEKKTILIKNKLKF